MGNNHGAQIKDRVLKLAREEEVRLRKAHRPALKSVSVRAPKVLLFDFDASPEYPEQLSARRDEVVFVVEHCGDGWSQVTNSKQKNGVVPTSFLGPVAERKTFQGAIKQKAVVLRDMAIVQANEKMWDLAGAVFYGLGVLITHVIVPGVDKLYRFASRSESNTSLIAGVVRNVHLFIVGNLIPMLDDDELVDANAQLQETLGILKEEKATRAAKAP